MSAWRVHWAQRTTSSWQMFCQQKCFMMTDIHWEECSITKKEHCLLRNSKNLWRLSAGSMTKNQGRDSYIHCTNTLSCLRLPHTQWHYTSFQLERSETLAQLNEGEKWLQLQWALSERSVCLNIPNSNQVDAAQEGKKDMASERD